MNRNYIKPISSLVALHTESTLMMTSVASGLNTGSTTDSDQTSGWSQKSVWNGSSSSEQGIWGSEQ